MARLTEEEKAAARRAKYFDPYHWGEGEAY